MSAIRTYRHPHGPQMRLMRTVRIGNWFAWAPFNLRPRIIVVAFGRKYVWALANAKPGRRGLVRLATGYEYRAGRLGEFCTLAAR